MPLTKPHVAKKIINTGTALVERDLGAFRARVGLALATSDWVVVDLTRTKHVDRFALLALVDLAENFAPRLTFATSEFLRESLLLLEPEANLDGDTANVDVLGHNVAESKGETSALSECKADLPGQEVHHSLISPLKRLRDSNLAFADSSDDIRGDRVIDRYGSQIGLVTTLFIDAAKREVRLFEVRAGGFLGLGSQHFILGVEAITRIIKDEVYVGQGDDRVLESSIYDPALVPQPSLNRCYGPYVAPLYWSACGLYPAFCMSLDEFGSPDDAPDMAQKERHNDAR